MEVGRDFIYVGGTADEPQALLNVANISHIVKAPTMGGGVSIVMTNGHLINIPDQTVGHMVNVIARRT